MEFQKASCFLLSTCMFIPIQEGLGKKNPPARLFGHADTHEHFPSLTDIRTLSDESESAKVHVTARDDGDKAFTGALEVVSDNVGFQACEGEGAGRFGDGPGFYVGFFSCKVF